MKRNRNKRSFLEETGFTFGSNKKNTRQMKRLSELARTKHLSEELKKEEKEIIMPVLFHLGWSLDVFFILIMNSFHVKS